MGKDAPLANDPAPSVTSKPKLSEAALITQLEGLPVASLGLCKSELLRFAQRPKIVL
jgi:hypothetical protein